MSARLTIVALTLVITAGCQGGLEDPRTFARLDEPYFRCKVQPVLAKSCSMFVCHGEGRRFLRVYARNRLRLGGDEGTRNAHITVDEGAANFDSARAMVDVRSPADSFLLRKPLEMSAGGYYHTGAVLFGQGNVFTDQRDPDYQVLEKWVNGATEDPACIEPGSDL